MARIWRNPAGSATGGALDRHSWRADGSESTADRRALQGSARVDELLVRLTDRLRLGHIVDKWQHNFALSILGQAKRGGRRWMPSAKLFAILEEIVERNPDAAENEPLIEEATDDGS